MHFTKRNITYLDRLSFDLGIEEVIPPETLWAYLENCPQDERDYTKKMIKEKTHERQGSLHPTFRPYTILGDR